MKRVLVTGGTGQVGIEFAKLALPAMIERIMPTRQEQDLTDADQLKVYVLAGRFDAVINLAAYTAVDSAESDVLAAFKVNALAPAALADATCELDIPLIHVSTDYVFDGTKTSAYVENDPIRPINVYGASKAAGEHAVRLGNPKHVILRTAWVFSPHGRNFVKTMLRLGDQARLKVVNDQHGCPTSASDIAHALAVMTLRLLDDEAAPKGTYHFVNPGPTTWCLFAREIFRRQQEHGWSCPHIEAISSDEYPTPARRPANSILSVERLAQDYGIEPRHWHEALEETLTILQAAE